VTAAFQAGGATDTGLLRRHNEDRFWIDADAGVFLVVDGMGGQAAGALAAETAVDAVREWLSAWSEAPPEERVREAIARANNRIFSLGEEHPELSGMGCVLTLALVRDGQITIGHVGDSRLYLIWKGAIRKLTSDHSPVGESEDAGEMDEADAMQHPRRNEVFRDVGSRPRTAHDEGFIEIRTCRFHEDAAILLCSDGLTDLLRAEEIRAIVESYDGDAASIAAELVEAANEAGGSDNVTALFVAGSRFRGGEGETRPRLSTTRIRRPARLLTGRLAFLVYGLLLAMLLWTVKRGSW
jgi:serine/threonine protein phosphatase PrpC